jgi:hypothetical protein
MAFDPDRDGWPLREAVMRTTDTWMMACLHRDMIAASSAAILYEQPEWWIYRLAPPATDPTVGAAPALLEAHGRRWFVLHGAIEGSFNVKIAKGELILWARPGAPHVPYIEVAAGAPLRIEDWACGTLVTCGFDAQRRFTPIDGGMRYYNARIEKPGLRQLASNKGGNPGLPCRPRCIKATITYFLYEGGEDEEDALQRAIDFMRNWISQNVEDGGPSSPTTIKDWAKQALNKVRAEKQSTNRQ